MGNYFEVQKSSTKQFDVKKSEKMREITPTIYFQPPGIKPKYCEAGTILDTDPEYIYYFNEPSKILIKGVKIIPKENVVYDKKNNLYIVKK